MQWENDIIKIMKLKEILRYLFDLEVAIFRKLVDIIEKYVQEKYFFLID